MPDKIENKPVVGEKQNQGNKLSDQAFDLFKQAALGGIGGAVLDSKNAVDMAVGMGGAAIAGAIAGAKAAEQVQGKAMGALGKAAADAVIGGTVGGAAAKAGMELAKELNRQLKEKQQEEKAAPKNNEGKLPEVKPAKPADNGAPKVLDQIGDALKKEAERQLKELKETPQDVIKHFQKRPVTTITEGMIGGPGAVILDAKLRKWFGDK